MNDAVPTWAWGALLTLLGLMAAALAWFVRREFDRMHQDVRDLRDEIRREVTPIRQDMAQNKALTVAAHRRLDAVLRQLPEDSGIRQGDAEILERWGRSTG